MIYDAATPETIRTLFDRIARRYDLFNSISSCGLHRKWNSTLVRTLLALSSDGPLLDLCSGTGEIALLAMKCAPFLEEGYLLDFSPQMLMEAEEKWNRQDHGEQHLHFLQADAQQIPLPDESIGLVTQSYGIRNVQDPVRCMREVHRLLRPGGYWGVLELTRPSSRLIAPLYRAYLKVMIPLIGKLIAGDASAYRYLSRSISEFMAPDELMGRLEEVGFEPVLLRSLCLGAAHLWIVKK